MAIFGIDTSNNNWSNVGQENATLAAAQSEGISFVWAKVSQGASFQDAYWPAARDFCQ